MMLRRKEDALTRTFAHDSGQATVEFALILPVLLLLILAMLDFAKAFNYWIDETHLASSAARWAVVNKLPQPTVAACGTQTIECQMKQQADTAELRAGGTSSVLSPGVTVTFCRPGGTAGLVGDPIQATVSSTYHWLGFLTGPFGIAGLTNKTIVAKATMRLEQKYDSASGLMKYTAAAC
jgi:hypothetical protein